MGSSRDILDYLVGGRLHDVSILPRKSQRRSFTSVSSSVAKPIGIIHAAGVLDKCPLNELTADRLQQVYAKIGMAFLQERQSHRLHETIQHGCASAFHLSGHCTEGERRLVLALLYKGANTPCTP
eukprot:1503739-Amphidinium_carterae.1